MIIIETAQVRPFFYHVKLSQIGTETFYCNHVWQMTVEERMNVVQHYEQK